MKGEVEKSSSTKFFWIVQNDFLLHAQSPLTAQIHIVHCCRHSLASFSTQSRNPPSSRLHNDQDLHPEEKPQTVVSLITASERSLE